MTALTDTAGLVGHGVGRVSEAVFGQVLAALIAFGFGFARAIGMVAILPIFTRLSLGMMLRTGVAFALALVVAPPLDAAVAPFMAGHPAQLPARVLFLLVKEGLLGAVLGVVMSLPFWIAEMIGELIDQQRGSQGALVQGGPDAEQAGILGTLMVLIFTMIFLFSGGMNLLLRGYVTSFTIWSPFAFLPHFTPVEALAILHLLDVVMRTGVLLAAPLIVAMLVAELSLGLINRFAQQLNVFDLALSIKGFIVAAGLCLYLMLLIGDFRHLMPLLHHIGARLESLTAN
jgi:type III secretion protein T